MKKQYLILFTSALFIVLFVNQDIGLNVSIFGLVLTGLQFYLNKEKTNSPTQKIIVVASISSCLAFAWYGDFVSFVALALSILFLQFRIQTPQLKMILVLPILLINAFACGALSKPHYRYQTRIVWLLLLVPALVLAGSNRQVHARSGLGRANTSQ